LLQQVAQRLTRCIREADTAARLGGDEFVVMLTDLSEDPAEARRDATAVGEKILAALNRTYPLFGKRHRSTPSIGITLFADQQQSVDQLLKQADLAMYQVKAAGRNALQFFEPGATP
jgi:diguanylate cyclase (GGDEF)-like protein